MNKHKIVGLEIIRDSERKERSEFNMAKVKQSDRHSPEKVIKCEYARHFQTSKSEALAMEELNYIKKYRKVQNKSLLKTKR